MADTLAPNAAVGSDGASSTGGTAGGAESPRRSTASKVLNHGGRRTVKWYSVNKPELTSLAVLQGMAAIFFSLATFLFGVWLSTKQGLEMADKNVDASIRATWETVQTLSGWTALVALILGLVFLAINGLTVLQIHTEHNHER